MASINIGPSSISDQNPLASSKNSFIKNALYFILGGVSLGIGTWLINGLFEKNPFYDGTSLWYIQGFVFLRPVLMFVLTLGTIIFFWNKQKYFALGVLTLSLILLFGYMILTFLYFGNPFSSRF